jgi:xylose isomerase
LLENGGPGGVPAYSGPRHFDYKPLRTEMTDGVWESASANMTTYLILKERAKSFRSDPEVQEALRDSMVYTLSEPTLDHGEDWKSFMADRTSYEDFDVQKAADISYGFVRLSQLAIEHALGAR